MNRSAIVVATSAEDRRAIAQSIKPAEFFDQVHFCSNLQETRFLLDNSLVDMLFCDVCSSGSEALSFATELTRLAADYDSQLVFFSHHDPVELPLLGVIPIDSDCLSYDSSLSTISGLLKRLLNRSGSARGRKTPSPEKLIDQNSGIYNRFYFDAFLDQELSRSKLTGRPFSLLLIESTAAAPPETFGGQAGFLPSLALSIKNQIRTSDLLCRIENKRLALLLPETSTNNAKRVMQRIQVQTKELEKDFPVDLKIGMASPGLSNHYNRHGLLREAEAAF